LPFSCLAGKAVLGRAHALTLLIVGGDDHDLIVLNREAYDVMRCEKQLAIVPGASHLFEEAGPLEDVAALAKNWFVMHFSTLHRSALP
jgi:putative phosphoribosyl transferase